MTTIAYANGVLASDKRCSAGSVLYRVTKIRKTKDGRLIGAAGTVDVCGIMLDWLEKPKARGARPVFDDENWPISIEIAKCGKITIFEQFGSCVVEESFHAIGSGRQYALAAMALGETAPEAVALAAQFDPYTGNGIDVLEL